MTDTVYCYAAAQAGMPGFCAVSVDEPKHRKDTAKFVAKCVRDGLAVTRVPLEEAVAGLDTYFKHRKATP